MSFNNAPFKKEDWDSILSLHQSGKAKNPHKVFGIGFNSVYHISTVVHGNIIRFMTRSPSKFIVQEICIQ